ncbi:MAG: GyrI-like domain-containing protein [Ferruginibacter sp.]
MNKVELEEIKLIGLSLKEKTSNDNGQSTRDCINLWNEFEKNHYADKIPGKSCNDIYGVYHNYEGDSTKPFSYFIGCRVGAYEHVPDGMQSLLIPGGDYYKMVAKGKMPDCVINTWKEIGDIVIPRSFKIDFEVYDERSRDWNSGEVDVYLSVGKEPATLGIP